MILRLTGNGRNSLSTDPELEAAILERWPHLARPGPNWETLERRDAGLPPRMPRAAAERIAISMIDHGELFGPIIQRLLPKGGASK
jgi:hypothetical protein